MQGCVVKIIPGSWYWEAIHATSEARGTVIEDIYSSYLISIPNNNQ
jgi:hypothetical protein